jgi:predicted RecA/RadA family phage recombinase
MKQMKLNIGAVLLAAALVSVSSFAAMNFVRGAGQVWYKSATVYAVGDVVDLGDRYGIALSQIGANTQGVVAVAGVYSLRHYTNETTVLGTRMYWDATSTSVTATATADKFIGLAVSSNASPATTQGIIEIDLNANLRPDGQATVTITNLGRTVAQTNISVFVNGVLKSNTTTGP